MKTIFRYIAFRCLAPLTALALAFAPGGAQAQTFSQMELEQILAPVALYPDPLLSQILVAAAYPAEVIEAARWTETHPGIAGEDALRAAEDEPWDPSVKALVAFPQVLAQMRDNLQWTQALGDAFVTQQFEVLDAVQRLRRRAQAAGNLRPDDRISVFERGTDLLLQPPDPQIVYVPYYDPLVIYGPWWWPDHPPVYLRPRPGHYVRPAYAGLSYWGPPVVVSARIFAHTIDFRRTRAGIPPRIDLPRQTHQAPDYHSVPAGRSAGAPPRFGPRGAQADNSLPRRPVDARRTPQFRAQAPVEQRTLQVQELPLPRPVSVNRVEPGARREALQTPQVPRAMPHAASARPPEAAMRDKPAARPAAPHERATSQPAQANPPRAEIRPTGPAPGQQPGARTGTHSKMQP